MKLRRWHQIKICILHTGMVTGCIWLIQPYASHAQATAIENLRLENCVIRENCEDTQLALKQLAEKKDFSILNQNIPERKAWDTGIYPRRYLYFGTGSKRWEISAINDYRRVWLVAASTI